MNLYLPISTASLSHYFACAFIKPACYFTRRPADIQSEMPMHLLLSDRPQFIPECCCIELDFMSDETSRLIPAGEGWFLYDLALPFSRVRKILFSDEVRMRNTIANIVISTAFVPRHLCVVTNAEPTKISVPRLPKDAKATDIRHKIEAFDRIIGAFDIMRTTAPQGVIPESYFGMLSLLCPDVMVQSKKAYGDSFSGKFQNLLALNNEDPAIRRLSGNVTELQVMETASRERQKLRYDDVTKVIDIDSLDGQAYILAILATYGTPAESRRKKIGDLILSGFTKGVKNGMSELVATYYGYNRGYSAFPKLFANPSAGVTKDTKFHFDSLVDYYTVESVYRHVFLNRSTPRSKELETWWPHKETVAGEKTVLDYTLTSPKVSHTEATPPPTSPGIAEIVRRHVIKFDPMHTTIFAFGLGLAADVARDCSQNKSAATDTARLVDRVLQLSAMNIKDLQYVAAQKGIRKRIMKKNDLIREIISVEKF